MVRLEKITSLLFLIQARSPMLRRDSRHGGIPPPLMLVRFGLLVGRNASSRGQSGNRARRFPAVRRRLLRHAPACYRTPPGIAVTGGT